MYELYEIYKDTEPDRRRLSDALRYVDAFRSFVNRPENDARYIQGRREYVLKQIDRLQNPVLRRMLREAVN